jgi:hypothetical protein
MDLSSMKSNWTGQPKLKAHLLNLLEVHPLRRGRDVFSLGTAHKQKSRRKGGYNSIDHF